MTSQYQSSNLPPAPPQVANTPGVDVSSDPFLSRSYPAPARPTTPVANDKYQTGGVASMPAATADNRQMTPPESLVSSDPFLMQTAPPRVANTPGVDVNSDPFLSRSSMPAAKAAVEDDPFLTHHQASSPAAPVQSDAFLTGYRASRPSPLDNDSFMTAGVATMPAAPVAGDMFFTGNQAETPTPVIHDPLLMQVPGAQVSPRGIRDDPYFTENKGVSNPPNPVDVDPFFTGRRSTVLVPIEGDPFRTEDPNQPQPPLVTVDTNPFMTTPQSIQAQAEADTQVSDDHFFMRGAQPPDVDRNTLQEPFLAGPLGQPDPNQSVGDDPFLTHEHRQLDTPHQVTSDIFMLRGQNPEAITEIKSDPFLTSPEYCPPDVIQPDPNKQYNQRLCGLQFPGDGDEDRNHQDGLILVMWPWIVFILVLLLWLILRHFSMMATIILTLLVLGWCFLMLLAWGLGRRTGRIPLITLYSLCLLAAIAGIMMAMVGWEWHWRQYWWMQTGQRFSNSTADSPALSRLDAAVVGFEAGSATSVDFERSAGYKDGHIYCAAPVLDPLTISSGPILVNYWAVGVDCCQDVGSFTCDDARLSADASAVVMVDKGFPCPTCNVPEFVAAVRKAESTHNLASANEALYIRWAQDPNRMQRSFLKESMTFVVIVAIIAFFVFLLLGAFAWYYGIGKAHRQHPFHFYRAREFVSNLGV